jgi:hypothetical protein
MNAYLACAESLHGLTVKATIGSYLLRFAAFLKPTTWDKWQPYRLLAKFHRI